MAEIGRFQIGAELGSGLYSVVYDAQDGDQRCALRVIKQEAVPDDPALRTGLVSALGSLKKLKHPSAVKVLDAGEEAGRLFVAMEFMASATLRQKLSESTRLPEHQVVLFTRQVAQVLDMAGDLGYCHNDLRAENVFVVSEERVKVSDFAVRSFVEEPPQAGQLGEPEAEAAESDEDEWVTAEELLRARGSKPSASKTAEDFAALGALMLEMLGADVPARADSDSLDAYRTVLLRGPYGQIASPESGVGQQTTQVVQRLLAEGGFNSAGEVVVELASAMLLARTASRGKRQEDVPAAAAALSSAGDTAQITQSAPIQPGALAPGVEEQLTECTPFFIWDERRGGRFFVIHEGEELVVGRDAEISDVTLRDPAISRKHIVLRRRGGTVTVEDLGSSNGIFVNGERVQAAKIGPGDVVGLGTTQLHLSLAAPEA